MATVKIYIESNFAAIDYGEPDINYIPNGYSDFKSLGNGNYCAFKSGGQLLKNYSFNYTEVRTKAGAVIGGGTESEVVLYLTTVFNTASGGSGASGFDYTATNYTDLTTNVAPTATEGNIAIVYNSQGVWLINRKLKGVYMYQLGAWEYANQELQNILQTALQAGDNVSLLTNDVGYITASSSAGGDLNGTYPNLSVKAITETGGATSLTFGSIADGEIVKRVGSTLVGYIPIITCCPFGGKSDETGKYLVANGKSSDKDETTKPKTRQPISIDGTLTKLVYKTKEGDTTTQMKVHVNGVVEETVNLTNINGNFGGVETIDVDVVSGDYVEIEFDANQKCGECTMYFIQELS